MLQRFFIFILIAGVGVVFAQQEEDWVRVKYADSVLYTINYLGVARGDADNILYGDSAHTHINLGVKCITGMPRESGRTTPGRGAYCTVSGGRENEARHAYATVGGGYRNIALKTFSVVGGGKDNIAHGHATVGGGESNTANASGTVGGGKSNIAGGFVSVVSGGSHNRARGAYSVVAGGGGVEADSNSAIGNYSTICGGSKNIASGKHATVAGGYDNKVEGRCSFAAGIGVHLTEAAEYTLAFGTVFQSSASNAVIFYSSLGDFRVGIGTTNPRGRLDVSASSPAKFFFSGKNQTTGNEVALFLTPLSDSQQQKVALITEAVGWWGKGHLHFALDDGNNASNADKYDARMTIRSDGYVGIGTRKPKAKLHVKGNIINGGGDFILGKDDGRYQGGSKENRALVHTDWGHGNDNLVINFAGDFEGGVEIDGPKTTISGKLRIVNEITGAVLIEMGKGLDYAEGFDVSDKSGIGPGTVLVIDPDNPGELCISTLPYDSKVAGIVSGANDQGSGVRLGLDGFDCGVALAGRVYCNVDATETGIDVGDLLTTARKPGYAMKAADFMSAQGAILGKAMERLEKGKTGQILVLVTLQ